MGSFVRAILMPCARPAATDHLPPSLREVYVYVTDNIAIRRSRPAPLLSVAALPREPNSRASRNARRHHEDGTGPAFVTQEGYPEAT